MLTLVPLLLAVLISDSHQQCFSDNDAIAFVDGAKTYHWLKSRQSFSISLLKALNKERSHQNLVFSPWKIQEALLLAYFGAVRKTEAALAKVLQIPANQVRNA